MLTLMMPRKKRAAVSAQEKSSNTKIDSLDNSEEISFENWSTQQQQAVDLVTFPTSSNSEQKAGKKKRKHVSNKDKNDTNNQKRAKTIDINDLESSKIMLEAGTVVDSQALVYHYETKKTNKRMDISTITPDSLPSYIKPAKGAQAPDNMYLHAFRAHFNFLDQELLHNMFDPSLSDENRAFLFDQLDSAYIDKFGTLITLIALNDPAHI